MNGKTIEPIKFPRWFSALVERVFTGLFQARYILFVIIPVIILTITDAVSASQQSASTTLHHFQLPCANCHDSDTVGAIQSGATGTQGKVNGDINQLCTQSGCHNYDAALDHPVGVRPSGIAAANMVLDEQSRITCLTCHASTNSSDVPNSFESGQDRMLSKPEGIKFCASCHAQMSGNAKKISHWQFSTRAHLGAINPLSSSSRNFSQFIGGIDTESRTCLSCHTDISAVVPGDNETQQQKMFRWRSMSDHPIGMDYRQVAVRKMSSFNYPMMANEQIRLFDGKLGCGSCHSLYAKTEKNLVVTPERGILCRSCHNK